MKSRICSWLCISLMLASTASCVRDTKYYDALGVSPDADEATIKKAYRRQALRYHPDRNPDMPDAEEKFREVATAYEILSDSEKRKMYDRFGEQGMQQGGPGGPGGGGGFHGGNMHMDPFNIFETVFGGGGGMGGGGQRMHFQFGGGGGGPGGGGFGGGGGGQQQFRGGGRDSQDMYKNDALIQELDDDTFPEGDGEGWVWLLEFYAPWCGHCKQLAPKYRKVAESLHGVVRVAAVNCEQQQQVCQQAGIRGYPTVKGFQNGKLVEYNGDRSAADLQRWALSLLSATNVITINKDTQMKDFLVKCSSVRWGVCILLFTPKYETSALYKSLALRYKNKLVFGEVRGSNKELAQQFNVSKFPTLLAVCGGSKEATIQFTDEMKNTRLTKFLNQFYSSKKCGQAIKFDADTDFSKFKVSQLKQMLEAKGSNCKDCVEKSDFVRKLQEITRASV